MNKYILIIMTLILTPVCATSLTVTEAIQLALKSKHIENFEIDQWIASANFTLKQDIYEPSISSDATYSSNQSQAAGTFAVRGDTQLLNSSVSKKTLTGTDLTLSGSLGQYDLSYGSNFAGVFYNESKVGISLSQALMSNRFGIQDKHNLQIQKYTQYIEDMKVLNELEAVIQDTITGYWALILAQKTVETNKEASQSAKKLLDVNKGKLISGLSEKRTVYALEADYLQKEAAYQNSIYLYQKQQREFESFLNIDYTPNLDIQLEGVVDFLSPKSVSLSIASVDQTRRYVIQQLRMEQESLRLKNMEDDLKPNVDLLAGASFNGIGNSLLDAKPRVGLDNLNANIGVRVTLPSEKMSQLEVEKQRKIVRRETNALELEASKIDVNIHNAYDDVQRLHIESQSAKKIAQLYKKKYDEDVRQFNLGRIQVDELLRSSDQMTRSKLSEQKSQFDYLIAVSQFYHVANILLDKIRVVGQEGE